MMISKFTISIVLMMIANEIQNVNSYKILGISVSMMKSDFIFLNALMKGLAEDGNEVTFITPFQPYDSPTKNYRHIRIEFPVDNHNSKGKPRKLKPI